MHKHEISQTVYVGMYILFFVLYSQIEIHIQPNMEYSRLIRWYLSDVFAAPVITNIIGLASIGFLSKYKWVPLVNMILCIIYELISRTDIIDICAYILGTSLFYITCFYTIKIINRII